MLNAALIAALVLFSVIFIVRIGLDLMRQRVCTMTIVYPTFFILFTLPALVLNLLVEPTFRRFPAYGSALSSPEATNAALAVLLACTIVWLAFFYRPKAMGWGNSELVIRNKIVRFGAGASLLIPFLLVLLAPQPMLYIDYGSIIAARLHTPAVGDWHGWVAMAARLAIFGAAILCLMDEKVTPGKMLFYILLVTAFCMIGQKRSFIAFSIILWAMILSLRGRFSLMKTIAALAIGVPVILGLSSIYVEKVKRQRIEVTAFSERWLVDFSRYQNVAFVSDRTLRERPILKPGQSYIAIATFFVPRIYWADKPYPYGVYYTKAVLNFRSDRLVGWGFTTSAIDEGIANFGFLGLALPVLFIGIFGRLNDRRLNRLSGALGIMVAMLSLVVHFAAFSYIVVLWLLLRASDARIEKEKAGRFAASRPPPFADPRLAVAPRPAQ